MQKQYYLTKWLSKTKADQLNIHIYKLPLIEQDERHSSLGKVVADLRRLNNYQTIVFYDLYLCSFEKIQEWGSWNEVRDKNSELRSVDLGVNAEVKLLERLLKQELINHSRNDYIFDRGALRSKQPLKLSLRELLIFTGLHIDVNVKTTGQIFIGFELIHRFEYKNTLQDLLAKNNEAITKGIKVVDATNRRTYQYEFQEIADYKASETSPHLNESIIDYYNRTNQQWKIKNVSENDIVVHVATDDGTILPYLARFLKVSCSYGTIPRNLTYQVNKAIKLSPEKRMKPLLAEVYKMLHNYKRLVFPKQNVLVDNLQYQKGYLSTPQLEFGKGYKTKNINQGLSSGGVYSGKNPKISFFVDPALNQQRQQIGEFIQLLIEQSKLLNVEIDISDKPREIRGKLTSNLFNSKQLAYELKSLGEYFDGTVVVIASKENIDNAYSVVKKEFGGRQDITTQFVVYDESLLEDRARYTILNILLGIYVKSGIQPWILGQELSSDCFIGLDVSHMDGKHSTGIIQVIGKDGRLIKQTAVSTHEAGEIISPDTLQEVVFDSLHSYEKVYKTLPKHITFHRDGKCREDLEKLEQILEPKGIAFDYIEVIKNTNRRMAVFENGKWFTEQGLYYSKGRKAYICSTSPREFVGMARPLKVIQKTNNLNFNQVLSDIYSLSFMHIHSMLKTRLPITTHYADISSNFHNRGLLHPRTEHVESLPFV